MSSNRSSVLTVAAVAAVGLVAYAVYFDYKRRNDVSFRKQLRKDKKRVDKIASSQASLESAASAVSAEDLADALERVKREEAPASPAERENYFMTQVATGEQLAAQGAPFYLPAALAFFRALRVYPSPMELMVIYEKTVPEPIFKLVIQMTQMDMMQKVQGYYDEFPPKRMNVSVKESGTNKIMVANKDFKKGDLIYKEQPVVAVLDADLQATGTYCSHCLRHLESAIAIKSPPQDALSQTYCSKACQLQAKSQSHNLLFTTERPLPSELPLDLPSPEALDLRRKAQAAYVAHLAKTVKAGPLLVGRYVARQINAEMLNLLPNLSTPADAPTYTDTESPEYGLGDHIERLKYTEVDGTAAAEGTALLAAVLGAAVPDLNQFITEDRMAALLGKMAYNAYGVSFGGGRDDRPLGEGERPEDQERTRTPYGTARQIGTAFYTLSAYATHSCEPAARASFSGGTAELHMVAMRDVKEGEEVTVAYVDVGKREGETAEEGRRRRRMEVARGWKFACGCERCAREAPEKVEGSA